MQRVLIIVALCAAFLSGGLLFAEEADKSIGVVEVRMDGQISTPQVYILRRAMREANAQGAQALVINMDTPGGSIATTLEIMELIADFKGRTICYINPNALSAGSFIANACDEIWFAPTGVMGAAEAVDGDGKDVGESMKRKIISSLDAKVKAVAGDENPNRAKVQRAMMDPDMELAFGDEVIKKKGELLSLSAKEAVKVYDGHPLVANGIAKNVSELLEQSYGGGHSFAITNFEISPLETAAKFISMISPVLMGLGIFLLIIEFKSGGFGAMGVVAVAMLAVVFLGAHVAGLAGYEVPILFFLGVLLLILEIFVIPGTFIVGIAGLVMMVLSLVLLGASPMPSEGMVPTLQTFASGVAQFIIALAVALVLLFFFGKYFKYTPLWRMFVLDGGLANGTQGELDTGLVGKRGKVLAALVPNGKVIVDGRSYDATNVDGTFVEKGDDIEVVAWDSFKLKIKKLEK